MIDDAVNAASTRLATGISTLRQALGADRDASQIVEQAVAQAKVPIGLPIQPIMPDFSSMAFDRNAPRGTYLNITV